MSIKELFLVTEVNKLEEIFACVLHLSFLGGGALGHPKVFINLDKGLAVACGKMMHEIGFYVLTDQSMFFRLLR